MSTRKFQIGDVVVVTDKVSKWAQIHHGIVPGMVGTVQGYNYNGQYSVNLDNGKRLQEKTNAFEKDSPKSSLEQFHDQIEKAEAKILATNRFIEETKNKIEFMLEVGTDQFDENEFKAFHTLTIIEQSGMSKIEKAKAIAALISGR
jgi:hypothetical protein